MRYQPEYAATKVGPRLAKPGKMLAGKCPEASTVFAPPTCTPVPHSCTLGQMLVKNTSHTLHPGMEWWKEKHEGRVGMVPNCTAEEGKEGDISSVSCPQEQGTAWFPKLENEPICSILIVSPPVYSHTAFLDDFFWRSFPYTQAETTPVLRTCGESAPLRPRDHSYVCSKCTGFQTDCVCQTLVEAYGVTNR